MPAGPERWLAALVAVPFLLGAASAASAPAPRPDLVLTFRDPAIVESSGLVARDGRFLTVNDSGDTGRVFVVAPSGRTVGVTAWGDSAVDVEALAPIGDDVLVGDLGDNGAARESVSLLRVPRGPGPHRVDPADAVRLVYPDGPHDAETLMVDPVSGQVLVATKGLFGGTLYAVPSAAVPDAVGAAPPGRPVRLRPVADVVPVATDGAFFPDGRHLLVRDYSRATVYSWPGMDVVARLPLPEQEQGEGIAVDERGRVFVCSEGQDSQVLRVRVPAALRRVLVPPPPSPTAAPSGGSAAEEQAAPAADRDDADRPLLAWGLGGAAGLLVLVLLVRALLLGLARRGGPREGPTT